MKSNPNEEIYIDDEKSPSISGSSNFKPKKSKLLIIAIAVIVIATLTAIILN